MTESEKKIEALMLCLPYYLDEPWEPRTREEIRDTLLEDSLLVLEALGLKLEKGGIDAEDPAFNRYAEEVLHSRSSKSVLGAVLGCCERIAASHGFKLEHEVFLYTWREPVSSLWHDPRNFKHEHSEVYARFLEENPESAWPNLEYARQRGADLIVSLGDSNEVAYAIARIRRAEEK